MDLTRRETLKATLAGIFGIVCPKTEKALGQKIGEKKEDGIAKKVSQTSTDSTLPNEHIQGTLSYGHQCILSGKTIGRVGRLESFSISENCSYDSFERQDGLIIRIPKQTRKIIDFELEMTINETRRLTRAFENKTEENWIVDFRDSNFSDFVGIVRAYQADYSTLQWQQEFVLAEISMEIIGECRWYTT